MAGVERERRQHRRDLPPEVAGEILRRALRVVGLIQDADAGGGELGSQFLGPAPGLLLAKSQRPRPRLRQLLDRGQTVE